MGTQKWRSATFAAPPGSLGCNLLADLAVESEATTLLAMRRARAFDEQDRGFARLAVAAGKYWITKRTAVHVAEALECLGGNGYVEECILPRLYREAPLNSIWEGSGNVIALDVLRAMKREPESLKRVLAEIRSAGDRRVENYIDNLDSDRSEVGARRAAERLAVALQASLLIRFSPPPVADAFCASRLAGDWGRTFGTLPAAADIDGVLHLHFRQFVAFAPRPRYVVVGLIVADESLHLRIPTEFSANSPRDVRQVADADGPMPDLDIGQRGLTAPHAIQPILHVIFGLPLCAVPLADFLLRRQLFDELGRVGAEVVARDFDAPLLAHEHGAALQIPDVGQLQPHLHAVGVAPPHGAFRSVRERIKLHRPGGVHPQRALHLVDPVRAPIGHLASGKIPVPHPVAE